MRWLQKLRRNSAETHAEGHIEIWDHFIAVNQSLKRMLIAMMATTFLAVVFATWASMTALTRPLVYFVDRGGQATPGGRAGDSDIPRDVEARFVARRFLQRTLAFNSLTIESDLAEAWNLMTGELRGDQQRELNDYERDRGHSFVDFIKGQEIRTTLDVARIEVENHNDKSWAVRVVGRARTWPLHRVGEEAGFEQREFEAQLTLVRVPRTELSPNGLLVAKQSTRFFETSGDADAMEQTVPSAPR